MQKLAACLSAAVLATFPAFAAKVVYTSSNAFASIAISDDNSISSLKIGGVEQIRSDRPDHLVRLNAREAEAVPSKFVTTAPGAFEVSFPRPAVTVKFHVVEEKFGWTFCLDSVAPAAGVSKVYFVCLRPACRVYGGGQQNMLNMMSDETYGVVLRGYDLNTETDYSTTNTGLHVYTSPTCGLAPARAGLVAGTRAQIPALLNQMRVAAGAPYSAAGGPNALTAPINHGSYLFASPGVSTVDDWIDLARRTGCTLIHADQGWTSSFGSYAVRTNNFPNGLPDFVAVARQIHAAGLKFGIHTFTGGVEPKDPLPARYPADLLPVKDFKLAAPVDAAATTIALTSPAIENEGKYLRVGSELISYKSTSGNTFAGLTRGACGTKAIAHAAGETASTLNYHYGCFSAIGGSPLSYAVGAALSNVVAATAANEVYFDAADMGTRLNVDSVRRALYTSLGRTDLQIEAACEGFHSWWFHSMLGAWDIPLYGVKRDIDFHIAFSGDSAKSDLLPAQTGWFGPCKRFPNNQSHGVFSDDLDYLGAKDLAHDFSTSFEGLFPGLDGPYIQPYSLRNGTIFGWYERARLAHAVDAQTLARLAVPGDEYTLRQQPDGAWRFQPLSVLKHRVTVYGNGSEAWTVTAKEAGKARLRILALNPPATNGPSSSVLISSQNATFAASSSGPAVKAAVAKADTPHGPGFSLAAANGSGTSKGAWIAATCKPVARFFGCSDRNAFGFWVNGDGKGERLLVEISEAAWRRSVHVFDIDFTGWRYLNFNFFERDVDTFLEDTWPNYANRSLYLNLISGGALKEISFALGRLPANGSCRVEVSPITSYRTGSSVMTDAVLTVNGQAVPVPFALNNADFAELDENGWVRYNSFGQELQAVQTGFVLPVLKAGVNDVKLAAASGAPAVPMRADVTFFQDGAPFGAVKARTAAESAILDREYMAPLWYNVAGGATNFPPILVRPGRTCSLEIQIAGYLSKPTVIIDGVSYPFETSGWRKGSEHLVCTDGKNWTVYDTAHNVFASGALKVALPKLSGGAHTLGFSAGGGKQGRFCVTKIYDAE